jgi:hypothetical protein
VEVCISAKLIGLFPLIVVPTSAAGVRNASVGAVESSSEKLERSKAGGTISQQAAVHLWLATNAQQQQQQQLKVPISYCRNSCISLSIGIPDSNSAGKKREREKKRKRKGKKKKMRKDNEKIMWQKYEVRLFSLISPELSSTCLGL